MQEISTATVQPRCGDERDSFQLRVEAVCRPGTLEQWWRWWWLWTRTRRWTSRWRGGWKKDSSFIDAPSTTAVQQVQRYSGGGRTLEGGQWGGLWIGCVGVVMHIPLHSGERTFNSQVTQNLSAKFSKFKVSVTFMTIPKLIKSFFNIRFHLFA